MTAVDAPRRYRFGALDRSGWLLGLGAVPCLVLGAGFLAAGLTLKATGSAALAALPLAAAAIAAFARYDGRAAHEWVAPLVGWASLRSGQQHRWAARVPLLGGDGSAPDLPPFLAGLEVQERPTGRPRAPRAAGVGLVVDAQAQLVSATVRVQGDAFALLEHDDQARVLDSWGAALAGFCRERSAISRVTWSEWAAPASLEDHLRFVRDQRDGDAPDPHWRDYVELVGRAGPLTIAHETLITLTVDRRRTRGRVGADPAIDALLDEVELFVDRVEHAGLGVDPPLGPGELAVAVRLRTDPSAAARLATRRQRLAERARVVAPHNLAPLAVDVGWRQVRVDQALHRCFWIADWPRLEMPADWLATLLLHPGGIRTVTVVHEPVSPTRSRRAVDREVTRLSSDEEERVKRGFRVRAQHRRAESEVLAREAELVAGYAELRYAGFLTVTAFDQRSLDEQSADWVQVAAQCGVELRALDGQHDLGVAVALPVGRVPTGRGRR
ncbi:MAG TPA: SCO6880 family protein [Acidimicrobiia bacterium]|nr:SCO6880 family protein [Acidimicrobiia bacterium]